MAGKRYVALVVLTLLITAGPLLWMVYAIYFGMRGDGGIGALLWNAALFAAFAVPHSLLARERPKKTISRLLGQAPVRIAYVWLSGLTLAIALGLWRPISGELWHTEGGVYWFLTGLYIAAVLALLYVTTLFDYLDFLGLRRAPRIPDTQSSKQPKLVVRGPYAYCRHPLYLAALALVWLGPVMSLGRLEFAALGSVYLFVGVIFEERNLRQELGPAYDLYRENVPRWIPRLRPWRYDEGELATAEAIAA